MSSSSCPICQCNGVLEDLKALSINNINDLCAACREVLTPSKPTKKKDPARNNAQPQARPRRKRAAVPGERVITTIPGVRLVFFALSFNHRGAYSISSRNPMVDSRQALNENYTILQAREQQLYQAIAELETQMALRNQPLPPARPPRSAVVKPENNSGKRSPTDLEVDVLADAFGVMSVREKSGEGQFVGPTASAEYLLKQVDKITKRRRSPGTEVNSPPPLKCFENYPELILLEAQFPWPPPQPPMDLGRFLHHLPEYEHARQMFENYIYYVTWITCPIPISLLHEILDLFYPDKCPIEHIDLQKGHRLAILFAVCLLGSYLDVYSTEEERTENCSKYRTLARAAMSAVPLSSSATVGGIQFCLFGFPASAQLPDTNGRDRYAYVQDRESIRRAEQTFWEYYTQDIFQSYFFGRPVTLHPSAVTCQWPEHDRDELYPEFPTWKYSMAVLMAEIIETTVKSTVSYKDVLKFDRQLRKHPIPKGMEWPNLDGGIGSKTGYDSLGRTLQRAFGSILVQMVLMVLHRPYFWQAVSKPGHELMKHPYWRSVVAAYHSASSLVTSILAIWQAFPQAVERFASFWSHCHSASLVLGAMVTLRPDSQFARESLRYLNMACEMFRAADQSATKHLAPRMPPLFRLQKKAEETYENFLASDLQSSSPSSLDVLSPASLSCLEDVQSPISVDSKHNGGNQDQEDVMMLDPGVYRLQEKGWDHLILQLGRNS
ncbi:hypothetical protein Clacol_000964 [Clathrus columnatus]|uniref:Transcription factor domain-containing protein n=1 Tax=Clathrus columnatus TaxID=1419009 RepID=A0AAV4ZZV8_9AGAM|nr:hypothetical protein Clacol_000964 [Clathrus columnatus]